MQENKENNQLIDNIAEEQIEDKQQSSSKIFFFVLGLHVVVIAGAIGLHVLRGPTTAKPIQTVEVAPVGNSEKSESAATREITTTEEEKVGSNEKQIVENGAYFVGSKESTESEIQNSEVTTPEPSRLAVQPETAQSSDSVVTKAETTKANVQQTQTIYIVRPGDSLSVIARRHNTTVARIIKDNSKNNEKIVIGERLVINTGSESTAPEIPQHTLNRLPVAQVQQTAPVAVVQQVAAQQVNRAMATNVQNAEKQTQVEFTPVQHSVTKGETLFSIARKYGVSVADIKKWNNLNSDRISIGTNLSLNLNPDSRVVSEKVLTQNVVPAQKVIQNNRNVVTHVVSSGDTLSSVARKYNSTVDQIKNDNELTTDFITIGQRIVIRPVANEVAAPSQIIVAQKIYEVRLGDTLSSISRTHGVPLEALFTANNLENPNIRVGQKLIIPKTSSDAGRNTPHQIETLAAPTKAEQQQPDSYTVQPGDTLFKIALKYGVTVDSLSNVNGIGESDILRVGQELTIPTSTNTEVARN